MRLPAVLGRLVLTLLAAVTLCTVPVGARWGAAASPDKLAVFDARFLRQRDLHDPNQAAEVWDTMHTLAAVQGLANRQAPRLYMLYCAGFGVETDQFWLDWLRGEDGWLKDSAMVTLTSPEEVVRTFRKNLKGLVVYD